MLLTLLQFFASKFLVLALHPEAGSFPRPLSPQEEIRTFAALRAGDSSAREKLIRHNLRLVAHIAKKYYALPSEQDDLISIGTIGLMKAVDTFDSTRRARFSTYASRCIENELRMHFRRERKNAPTLSLQETLDAGKEDSALTLADVLQDGFCSSDLFVIPQLFLSVNNFFNFIFSDFFMNCFYFKNIYVPWTRQNVTIAFSFRQVLFLYFYFLFYKKSQRKSSIRR